MKVLLVNGSPHQEGNTNAALLEIARQLEKEGIGTEVLWLGMDAVSGCRSCYACINLEKCVINDCVNTFLDKAAETDGFIFGSPVHFGSASGTLTSFMDRVFYADLLGKGNRFYLKPAAAITTARRAGTTATLDQLNKYFSLMQMPIVTSQYWNLVHGGSDGQVEQDAEGLQTMRTLARNMAFMLKCKQVALENGVSLPEREATTFTNFIR